jgi:hypothetical protein
MNEIVGSDDHNRREESKQNGRKLGITRRWNRNKMRI